MFKKKLYAVVEKGSHGSKANLVFDYLIMGLIVLNVIALILETLPSVNKQLGLFFKIFEIVSVIIFTIEYLVRIYISSLTFPSSGKIKSAVKFILSPFGLIDLFAILPFYLPFLIAVDLRFLRILRLLRFMRVLKISRYNNSLKLIYSVIREKKSELLMTGFVALLVLLISSFLMYYVEGDAQPDKFPNMLACFWWAIATLTTVGYGDVFPITGLGKFLSGIIAVLGVGLVALPTGIISAGFIDKIGKRKSLVRKCPHCGEDIYIE